MQAWHTVDKTAWGTGPWLKEPDKVHWIDAATDLDCLIVRNHGGALCGYVGVPPGHPWHGVGYDHVPVGVHGGLTYAEKCPDQADETSDICHVPLPGRPHEVWWLGFDCSHGGDYSPAHAVMWPEDFLGKYSSARVYRTIEYVTQQCTHLAARVREAGK